MIRYGAAISDVRLLDSALHEASARNNLTAMRILLRARADVWVLRRQTLLHLASPLRPCISLLKPARIWTYATTVHYRCSDSFY